MAAQSFIPSASVNMSALESLIVFMCNSVPTQEVLLYFNVSGDLWRGALGAHKFREKTSPQFLTCLCKEKSTCYIHPETGRLDAQLGYTFIRGLLCMCRWGAAAIGSDVTGLPYLKRGL